MSRYQKGRTNLDYTEARESEWQWHQLGHMQVCTSLQTDNRQTMRHLHILIRRFSHCSFNVKLRLLRSFCICFLYDIALWRHVKATVVNKFKSAYVKCLKMFFNFHKYSSVSDMFLQLGLPTFCTVSHNAERSSNMLVRLVTKFSVVSP